MDSVGEALDLSLECAALVKGEVLVVLWQSRLSLHVREQHQEEQRDLVASRAPPSLPFFSRRCVAVVCCQPCATSLRCVVAPALAYPGLSVAPKIMGWNKDPENRV
jgi:hypothetical protein